MIVYRKIFVFGLIICMVMCMTNSVLADDYLDKLTEGQKIHGFSVNSIYLNSSGAAMGGRFISDDYGFIIDLLRIESVPQAFFWVKTPTHDDMGEPHACEHLLLGKGVKGRYVSALEDMSLGKSSAWTSQVNTVYHFNTVAGIGTFYDLFQAKLDALLNPDFTDEEILREVCHIGVNVDPETGKYVLDEKGTVYTEMVSSYEKPSRHLWQRLGNILYGDNHPMANASGGFPDSIRNMTAKDMWDFHKDSYILCNMGVIASIPTDVSIDDYFKKMDGILRAVQEKPVKSEYVGMNAMEIPPPDNPDMPPITEIIEAAGNPSEPQAMYLTWPATLDLEFFENMIVDAFMGSFSQGETSDLYDVFINSETRKIDLGANGVWGYVSVDYGHPIMFGLNGVAPDKMTAENLDKVRQLIIDEIRKVYNYADGSDEIKHFNKIAMGQITQNRKYIEKLLNAPPKFGFRMSGGEWQSYLESIERLPEFKKQLTMDNYIAKLGTLLSSDKNFWKEYIDKCNLLTVQPHALGVRGSEELMKAEKEAKQKRLAGYIERFKQKYGVTDEQEAIAKYKEDFDKKTAELEAIAADDQIPGFISNPPMTLDDQLNYEVMKVNNIDLVASTFENMTSSLFGLALGLNVLPEEDMVYVPFLTAVVNNIGVVKDGQIVKYDEMQDRLRNEVLYTYGTFDLGYENERVELVLKGSGTNIDELKNAMGWIDALLFSPYLEKENTQRMLDVIDQTLVGLRRVMQGREENWVRYPARAYQYQTNPLILSANCFLTKIHSLQRIKWMLSDPGTPADQTALDGYLANLLNTGKGKTRAELQELLTAPPDAPANEYCQKIVPQITKELLASLGEIPDATLEQDWEYLIHETSADLKVSPQETLDNLNRILALIRKTDNARMYLVSSSTDREAIMGDIENLVGKLDSKNKSVKIQYAKTPRIDNRLNDREPDVNNPTYVGLVYTGTRNGVLIFSAKESGQMDTSEDAILAMLSGKLYSGGGGHGLFMRTWSAGLAYSNGFSCGPLSGNVSYYAERCPDVAETMGFVVNELKQAHEDPRLAEYALAQVFGDSRAPSEYESRGEAIASDLVDGYDPAKVAEYRHKVLEISQRDGLYHELFQRMPEAYGPVLIGYGNPSAQSNRGVFFMIGPDEQFQLLENYINTAEGSNKVHKLYPRDFWLTI